MPVRHLTAAIALLLLSAGCATQDFDYPREPSSATDPATASTLKARVDDWIANNPGPSGFYPLLSGTDALGARLRLIEQAEKSIDAQYFLMKEDEAGYIFVAALFDAADRGVRVRLRLLLDDIFSTLEDEEIAIIASHPNVEFRLYNPIARRGLMVFNYLGDFERANRRMHNKSFIADNQVAIVGGRNIADEYFELRTDGEFLDFDLLALGPVAADVSREFDAFWNHERALPAEAVVSSFSEERIGAFRRKLDSKFLADAGNAYRNAVDSTLMLDTASGDTTFYSAHAEVLTDDPDKLTHKAGLENAVLVKEMADIVQQATTEVVVLSPYFVPGDNGVAFWKSVVDKGVRVIVITNSLASNNHTAVHSGYARYRQSMIAAGIELYEARANAAATGAGAKKLTLHTKAMLFDRQRLFVGSLNLDPRSIEINSEMGLVVDSPDLAGDLAKLLLDGLGDWTYRVRLNDEGKLRWHATIDGVDVV